MNLRLWQLQLIVFLAWLLFAVGFGYFEVTRNMAALSVTPSPDLYANDLGFQVLAFALTKGLALILVLGLAFWRCAYVFRARRARGPAT